MKTISLSLFKINREKPFENRGGCIFHSHHLPKWAHDDSKIFFQAANKYEGVGNRKYKEIEFALPNELKTDERYRKIIDAFIGKHLSDHYYAYAIHNKIGVMSEGQHHPHFHSPGYRSLKAQKEEAERNGDSFLARFFNRIPEKYMGLISCQEDDEPRLERLKKFRALRKQHFDMI